MRKLPIPLSDPMVAAISGPIGEVPDGVTIKPVPNLSGKYFAGTDGEVYAVSSSKVTSGKSQPFKLKPTKGSAGYLFVAVILEGKRKTSPVHRMVCSAFHGEKPSAKMVVRHLDGVPDNNRPENLAWGTYAQNEADKKRHGRTAMGERHGNVKLTEEGVRIIRASVPYGLWDSVSAAKVFGVDVSTINRIANGKVGWRHLDASSNTPEPIFENIDKVTT